jgi:hypothetical protein
MSEWSGPSRVNWRQAWGEALLIFLGVAVALLGQAWWEYRTDRELEAHLLTGIRGDLERDSSDIASAIGAAMGRAAGADYLLQRIGDPDAGVLHPTPWDADRPGVRLQQSGWLDAARTRYEPESVQQALYMIVAGGSMQRLDLSDPTFSEATASGQLNVIRDTDLRTRISDYYFDSGRFGSTTGSRVDAHWQHFRNVLAQAGLPAGGGGTDAEILTALRQSPSLVVEVENVRNNAIYQLGALDAVSASLRAVISSLDERAEASEQ